MLWLNASLAGFCALVPWSSESLQTAPTRSASFALAVRPRRCCPPSTTLISTLPPRRRSTAPTTTASTCSSKAPTRQTTRPRRSSPRRSRRARWSSSTEKWCTLRRTTIRTSRATSTRFISSISTAPPTPRPTGCSRRKSSQRCSSRRGDGSGGMVGAVEAAPALVLVQSLPSSPQIWPFFV